MQLTINPVYFSIQDHLDVNCREAIQFGQKRPEQTGIDYLIVRSCVISLSSPFRAPQSAPRTSRRAPSATCRKPARPSGFELLIEFFSL
jgi:hypothetical protein